MKREKRIFSLLREALHRLLVVVGACALAVALFLTLPLLQAITQVPEADLTVRSVDAAEVTPPPPPPPEEEKKADEKPEDEPEPPKLMEESTPLDLSQLELALDLGMGGAAMGGDFAIQINTTIGSGAGAGADAADETLSIDDLDQAPRLVHSPAPAMNDALRKKAPGKVVVIFFVDINGRVENPVVQTTSDPAFERPALNAIKQWRFEPGKRKGAPVRFRMRQSITFPKSG